jgi:hypothetical protein
MPIRLRTGLATLMAAIAVLAACFAAMRAEPGFGILVALFLVPAALRASLHIEARRAEGRPMSWSEKNDSIALSIMLALLLLPAAGIAFVATCVPVTFCATNGFNEIEFEWRKDAPPARTPPGVIVACAAGLLMGIFASIALGRKFWPRKDR